ncbi:MAG: YhgE/Pip family protein [Atopobiaceae bacterium]|jgi:putative membrane protein
MKKVWLIFKQDFHNATKNVIALIVCIGLIIIPSLYAWFNIAGSWDPYGHTDGLRVAVANTDEGYTSKTLPMQLNLGQEVSASLAQSEKIGYEITTKEEAEEGVRAGTYYAAIVIPENFTERLLSFTSSNVESASMTYLINEKENAIAPIVTDKAVSALQSDIQESLTATVSEVGINTLVNLDNYLSDDETLALAQNISAELSEGSSDLRAISQNVNAYAHVLSSASRLIDSSQELLASTDSATSDASDILSKSADGMSQVGNSLDIAASAINTALDSGSASMNAIDSAVDQSFDAATTTADHSAQELDDVAARVETQRAAYADLAQALRELQAQLPADMQGVLDGAIGQVDGIVENLAAVEERLNSAAASIRNKSQSATDDRAEVQELLARAKEQVGGLKSSYQNDLRQSISTLAEKIMAASGSASSVSGQVAETLAALDETSAAAAQNLHDTEANLSDVSTQISGAADDLDGVISSLQAAAESKDLAKVRQILSAGSQDLSQFISTPVTLERVPIYAIENNGSAMAGFYTTLSLWVGAIVLVAMMRTDVSDAEAAAVGAAPRHRYLGRLGVFCILGMLQATLVALGDIFYLGIQCVDPVGFLLVCQISSIIYVNIMYALTVSFGDVGKAISVFLLVIQVAGSGGTFPVQMLPSGFQAAYPYLPFVHTISAMHECIAGHFGTVWLTELAILCIFLVASLILGLALRKPVVRLNNWIIKKLEDTKIM